MGLQYKYTITAKNGRYYVIVTYKDKDGKRRTRWKKTGTTDRREAEQAAPKIASECYKAATKTAETVEEVAEEWKNAAIGTIDPVTLDGYKILLNSYILPYIGNCKISEITAENVAELYKTLLKEGRRDHCGGLKRESVKKARSVLVHILKHAERFGAITTDERRILEAAEIPKTHEQTTRPTFYTAEELLALLEEAKKNKVIYFCVFFASVYGLRRSEIAGIKWGAVDFKTKRAKHNQHEHGTKSRQRNKLQPINGNIQTSLFYILEKQKKRPKEGWAGKHGKKDPGEKLKKAEKRATGREKGERYTNTHGNP